MIRLTYVGYTIDDLAENASFEEVVYLLWHKELPNQSQLDEFKKQLADNASVPAELLNHLKLTQSIKYIQWGHYVQQYLCLLFMMKKLT